MLSRRLRDVCNAGDVAFHRLSGEVGHLLIGLSLISGFLVRVSGPFGILLMITYYFAHMQFPFIEDHLNYLVDFHLVYATVLVYLIAHRAGHVFGLDGLVEQLNMAEHYPVLRPLFG